MPQPTEITHFIFGQPLRQITRAVETRSSVWSSYADALACSVSSCVNRTVLASRGALWCRAASQHHHTGLCQGCLEVSWVSSCVDGGRDPPSGAHRHSGTDAGNSQRARRVALACEIVGEDCITRSKTARGAIADPDFHLPRENKNVLSPGRGVPIAEIVRRETAEHEIGTHLKRNVMALVGRQREIFKMGLAVIARTYPYDHARAPSNREIIVDAKAHPASH